MKNSLFKLKNKASQATGMRDEYLNSSGKSWSATGDFFTSKKLLAVLEKIKKDFEPGEDFSENLEIIEFQMIPTRTTTIPWFIQFKSHKPIVRGIS